MCDDDAVATLHFPSEDALASIFLGVEDHSRSLEVPQTLVDTRRLHHTAILSNVSEEHRQAAIFGVSMFDVTYASVLSVLVERPCLFLAAHLGGELASRGTGIDAFGLIVNLRASDVVFLYRLFERQSIDTRHVADNQSTLVKFIDDAQDATRTVALLHAVTLRVRSQLAEARHFTRERIDVRHFEVDTRLLRYRQQVKDRIGAATHGYVERHGVEECLACGYGAWEHALVALLIIGERIVDNLPCRVAEEGDSVLVSGQYGAVTRQRQSNGLGERVHRVGREHARAATTSRTGTLFEFFQFIVGHRRVSTFYHCRHEVGIFAMPVSSLHWSTATENGRDVQTHGCHEHTRRHLVAVGDTYHSIRLMGIDHIFDGVGDDVA